LFADGPHQQQPAVRHDNSFGLVGLARLVKIDGVCQFVELEMDKITKLGNAGLLFRIIRCDLS
jgi:hypothetical protein